MHNKREQYALQAEILGVLTRNNVRADQANLMLDDVKRLYLEHCYPKSKVEKPIKLKARYRCLKCDHADIIQKEKKEDFKEIEVCPKCQGAFVDIFREEKYLIKINGGE